MPACAAGPWLFGDLSIADCMYAPVVSRCHAYGTEVCEPARACMDQLLGYAPMRRWLAAGAAETEVIEAAEVGRPAA